MPLTNSGPGVSSQSQYFRSYYNPLYQPQAEKISYVLALAAETVARAVDPEIHTVLPNHEPPP
eukprot:9293362-Ditylum_brightwellii.AAC.1